MAPAIDQQDKRSERVDSRVSPRELALIGKLAAEQEMPDSQWVRDAILEKLRREAGYEDEARRAAPRRRNLRSRKDGQQREEGTPRDGRKGKEMTRYRVYLQGTSALHIDVEAEDAASAYEKAANLELGEWDWPEGDITEFVERINTERAKGGQQQ